MVVDPAGKVAVSGAEFRESRVTLDRCWSKSACTIATIANTPVNSAADAAAVTRSTITTISLHDHKVRHQSDKQAHNIDEIATPAEAMTIAPAAV